MSHLRWMCSRCITYNVEGSLLFVLNITLGSPLVISLMQMRAASKKEEGKCYWKPDSSLWKMLCH